MAHAELCPVCSGTGKVKVPTVTEPNVSNTASGDVQCHGCGGLGWIQVGDENPA